LEDAHQERDLKEAIIREPEPLLLEVGKGWTFVKQPIGLILCTETSREQIELLQMHRDGIVVAEYWTDLLPKKVLKNRFRVILRDARERVARRALPPGPESLGE
jgi:hypothetical protein